MKLLIPEGDRYIPVEIVRTHVECSEIEHIICFETDVKDITIELGFNLSDLCDPTNILKDAIESVAIDIIEHSVDKCICTHELWGEPWTLAQLTRNCKQEINENLSKLLDGLTITAKIEESINDR